jgi:hypothetical protein
MQNGIAVLLYGKIDSTYLYAVQDFGFPAYPARYDAVVSKRVAGQIDTIFGGGTMLTVLKRSCILLLAVPIAVLAEPVSVTTHSAGTIILNSVSLGDAFSIMNVLGLDPPTTAGPLPYELTLKSNFDTDTLVSPEAFWAYSNGADVEIDFHIGTQIYHYTGPANSTVNLYAQSANVEEYGHTIGFDTPGYAFGFHHQLLGPPGSMGLYNPLAPLYANQDDGLSGGATLSLDPSAPDVLEVFSIGGGGPIVSVSVAAVPEPASFALLATGLLTLGLLRRIGRMLGCRRS